MRVGAKKMKSVSLLSLISSLPHTKGSAALHRLPTLEWDSHSSDIREVKILGFLMDLL